MPAKQLRQKELRNFFISHLNRLFCAKSQLADKLPELACRAGFTDLQQAIKETIDVVKNQLVRMKQVYILLDAWYQTESCIGVRGILDEAFQSIGSPEDSADLRDLSIIFYMQSIESVEMSSFKMMLMVANKLPQQGIAQLLLECYDEAKEDHILLKEITKAYV